MDELEHVLAAQDELGEGPVWDAVGQALYWVDIERGLVHRFHPSSGDHRVMRVGKKVGALALREGGGMVMATEVGFAFWDEGEQSLRLIGDPEAHKPQTRFNDGAADRRGRFWAGTMGDPYHNHLYRLDPDLSIHTMESGIDISNGIGWSPDNRVMYYTDSTPGIIYAYDFDVETGEIANRRVWVDRSGRPGVPDGLTVDSEGFVWSACWDGWCVERYDPQGNLERTIHLPVPRPTSVMFGGPNLDVLYITSARTELSEAALNQSPLSGDLFCLQPGVRGLPEPRFAG